MEPEKVVQEPSVRRKVIDHLAAQTECYRKDAEEEDIAVILDWVKK